jgi:hypothetical protein
MRELDIADSREKLGLFGRRALVRLDPELGILDAGDDSG